MDFIATFLLALLLQANVTNSNVGFETNPNPKLKLVFQQMITKL
jgi:hypothetical protein